ncbi:MAG: LysM peptidoglycan-binding domain-containing protein [Bacteroidales bacterium]
MNKAVIRILLLTLCFPSAYLYSQENDPFRSATNNAPDNNIFYHTVERGQTVYSISTMYGVGEEDIYRLNPRSREVIRAGEQLMIPQKSIATVVTAAEDEQGYVFHTIQPKETLYSLSVKYNLPASAITEANPGLSVSTFLIGRTIRIPATNRSNEQYEVREVVKEVEYKVRKKETLYGISRKFGVSPQQLIAGNPRLKNGIREGMVIKIPVKTEEKVQMPAAKEKEVNALLSQQAKVETADTIRIVLLLPFMTTSAAGSANTTRFIEYYEGMLLAIDSLRSKGISVHLTVRDTGAGTSRLKDILKESALTEAHLIVGALENDQIDRIATFAKQHGIKYIIPFTSKNDHVLSNAFIFQVNTPQSYLCSKASQAACNLFSAYNIIFIETGDEDKTEFINAFKQELSQHRLLSKTLPYNEETFLDDVKIWLSSDKRNVIVPTSGTLEALNKIRTPLHTLASTHPEYVINLFGYPEWQTYKDCLDDFFALDTYIYTNFYADNLSAGIARFTSKYKIWFSKNMANTYPKYGILGFDTGLFFLEAISRYGVNFEANLGKMQYQSLQTGFQFQRVNNWGGFINTNLFIVHYDRNDYKIVRNELSR